MWNKKETEKNTIDVEKNINRLCMVIAAVIYIFWLIIWAMPYAHNEVLTVLHQGEFRSRYTEGAMRENEDNLVLCKVLRYSKDAAEVYYVMDGGNAAEVYTFVKNADNAWEFDSSRCLWSQGGNADELLWPYIGQYFFWKIV